MATLAVGRWKTWRETSSFLSHDMYTFVVAKVLPKEFIREDVKALRIAQGMKPNPREMLAQWVRRGVVLRDDDRRVFVKN